tara:strand:- start:648 stop:815 length:168 start_codon:yes stop_codon:yes gene_type:complete
MPLRSGKEYLKQKKLYNNFIDFDESSREWRKNKIHLGEGLFLYKRYSERIFNLRL